MAGITTCNLRDSNSRFEMFVQGTKTQERLARWRKWRACDVGEAKEGLDSELWRMWSNGRVGQWTFLILQTFRHFTYVRTHSRTLPSLYVRHSSFSNPSVASSTSQLILQPFFRFYVTGSSLTSPGEPPMIILNFILIEISYPNNIAFLTI